MAQPFSPFVTVVAIFFIFAPKLQAFEQFGSIYLGPNDIKEFNPSNGSDNLIDWQNLTEASLTEEAVKKLLTSSKFLNLMLSLYEPSMGIIIGNGTIADFFTVDKSGAGMTNFRHYFYYLLHDPNHPKTHQYDDIAYEVARKGLHRTKTMLRIIGKIIETEYKENLYTSCMKHKENISVGKFDCLPYFDGTTCWPAAKAGKVTMSCPGFEGSYPAQNASITCSKKKGYGITGDYHRCVFPPNWTKPDAKECNGIREKLRQVFAQELDLKDNHMRILGC